MLNSNREKGDRKNLYAVVMKSNMKYSTWKHLFISANFFSQPYWHEWKMGITFTYREPPFRLGFVLTHRQLESTGWSCVHGAFSLEQSILTFAKIKTKDQKVNNRLNSVLYCFRAVLLEQLVNYMLWHYNM